MSPARDKPVNEYAVAHSAIFQEEGKWAAIVDPSGDVVNNVSTPFLKRLLPGAERYLVSATPPYRLAGPRVAV